MNNENQFHFTDLFPRASKSFIEANPQIFAPQREPDQGATLDGEAQRKAKSDARPLVSIILHRCRLLDKENAYGATKILTDCLCQVGLISGDSEAEIDLQVTQEKVAHRNDQRTEVRIIYP
jgi:hypothetical protein